MPKEMLPIVDKPTIQYIVEEAISAGIEEMRQNWGARMKTKAERSKVLLYSIHFSPELTGIGKYNAEMVRWLTERGYEVRVITAPPYYPHWKVQGGYSGWHYSREQREGARVWRCPVWIPKRVSGVKRLIHLLSFAVTSVPVLIRQMAWRPDVCLVVEPPLAISPVAVIMAKLFGIKTWLHVQDFEVDAAFELGLLPNRRRLRSVVLGLERWIMRRFDAVSSVSEPMTNRLRDKGVQPERIKLFPNWVDVKTILPLPVGEPNEFRRALHFPGNAVVALYSGNIGDKQGLETVLETASLLQTVHSIRFVLCGEGTAKQRLMEQARRMGLMNIRFLPLQPPEKLNELLAMADIHLLIQKRHASDLVMPSKLAGMLASGRPVIATAEENSAVHAVIMKSGAGLLVPPEDPDMLADALAALAHAEEERVSHGAAARRYAVAHLEYESVMAVLQTAMKELGVEAT